MIEPQNTMMPLPAESAPAEAPQSDGGFGEMLAQTLGMIPQLDPNAVQKLMADNGEQGEESRNLAADSDTEEPKQDHVAVGRYIALSVDGNVSISRPGVVTEPIIDTEFVNPVFEDEQPPSDATVEPAAPEAPHPTNPPIDRRGDDGIWQPVLTDEPTEVATGPAVDAEPIAVEPIAAGVSPAGPEVEAGELIPEPAPVKAGPEPLPEPGPVSPEVPIDAAPVVNPADPAVLEPLRNPIPVENLEPVKPSRRTPAPVADRGLPTMPTPESANRPAAEPVAPIAPIASNPTQAAPVADTRVGLTADAPVRIPDAEVRLNAPSPLPVAETTATIDTASAPTAGGMTAMTTDAPAPATAPVSNFSAPDAPVQNSALAERVIRAVELQASQPPPRTMVVDIPEIEGLRLVVSVRAGAEVHVVPSSASTATDGLQPFLEELQGVLEDRGFVMTGDERRRGRNPNGEDQPEQRQAPRPTFRRPVPTDNDLRI